MPGVPWVRPSHGSEQKPAKGRPPSAASSWAAACMSNPISQWPVW